jgi:hypothetical protein
MKYLRITLFFLLAGNSIYAQNHQSYADLENEILGSWHLENDPRTRLNFLENGVLKRYVGDELQSTNRYEITKTCCGEELKDQQFFLKEINKNGNIFCAYIEAINLYKGFFTLMTKSQGKVIVLKKINPNGAEE